MVCPPIVHNGVCEYTLNNSAYNGFDMYTIMEPLFSAEILYLIPFPTFFYFYFEDSIWHFKKFLNSLVYHDHKDNLQVLFCFILNDKMIHK